MNFLVKALERFWYGCGGHCHCSPDGVAACPLMNGNDPLAPLMDPEARRFSTGFGLVGACLLVFVLPLATGLLGAFLLGRLIDLGHPARQGWIQLLGLLAGLGVGVGLAKLVLRLTQPRVEKLGGGEE